MRNIKIITFLTITIALGFLVSACTDSKITADSKKVSNVETDNAQKRGTNVGELAPEFELATVSGEKISLESLKGNPTVLVFWSYYCPVCEEEAPHINKLNAEFAPKGVQVVGVNIGESEARVRSGIKDFGIKYTVARDEGSKVTKQYGVIGTPTVIFLDKQGFVKYNANKLPEDYAKRLNSLIS